ncbi:hypothetical protein SAMN05660462_00263 [Proteiniborus ethanoligenes]|uniref:Uncharacterized protein n=1 Tax=Proteiniborus ethanoligenes TaxID=415015 RepID=A0A1H3KQH5_9FIRM|nr:hypothetical protein [Proteiniborus ethanoligenes]SDY53924.1 hypothetical protein SAMN05660462_00263 [Proteiniborus ethanoligenes]
MKNKNIWLLLLSLGLCSSTILIDRFIVDIPDWLAIILALIAIISLVGFFFTNRVLKK